MNTFGHPLPTPADSTTAPSPARLFVVGASAGGVAALLELFAALPADFPAAVAVALHVGDRPSMLPAVIARRCRLQVSHAHDGDPLSPGHIHVAPPDHHLLVVGRQLRLTRGPKEHHTRPAIDPMFSSAAMVHGPAVVGVVLTGMLDDGTAGLQAIKERGGQAIVQDPAEAFAPSMPASALRHVHVDHCLPLSRMGGLLCELAAVPVHHVATPAPERLRHEHELVTGEGDAMEHLEAIGTPSPFACPQCHGGLWEVMDSRPQRYRCHTGHGYTLRTLQQSLASASDEAGRNALRSLQERQLLLRHMALQQRATAHESEAERTETAARRVERQVEVLRKLLEDGPEPLE